MKKSLIDTGPVVALFDASDNFHESIYEFVRAYRGAFFTTWPVVTEISYLLEDVGNARFDFLRWMESGAVQLLKTDYFDIPYLRFYMEKYKDIPMDLADASLLYMSDKSGIRNIVSLDGDFDIYRADNKKPMINLVADLLKGRKGRKRK